MEQQFDKKLAQTIREKLQDHQVPYMDGAWEKLESQLDKPTNRAKAFWPAFWPRIAMAAAVAALIAGGWFSFNSSKTESKDGATAQSVSLEQTNNEAKTRDQKPFAEVVKIKTHNDYIQWAFKPNTNHTDYQTDKTTPEQKLKAKQEYRAGKEYNIANQNIKDIETGCRKVKLQTTELTGKTFRWTAATPTIKKRIKQLPDISTQTNDKQEVIVIYEHEKESKNQSGISLGLGVSSLTSYSIANTSSELNAGAAIVSEIPISRRLNLYTGLSYANQSITYIEEYNNFVGSYDRNMAIDLKSLDIPLNLKYRLSAENKRNDWYIVMGMSSTAYLQEDYNIDYEIVALNSGFKATDVFQVNYDEFNTRQESVFSNYDSDRSSDGLSYTENPQTTTESYSVNAFDSFYWGKLINVALGISHPLSPSTDLLIEPYLKIPVGKNTYANRPLGSAGVSLRLNFSFK